MRILNRKMLLGAAIAGAVTLGSIKVLSLVPPAGEAVLSHPRAPSAPATGTSDPPATGVTSTATAGLAEMLEWEVEERIRLQQRVDELEDRIARMESGGERSPTVAVPDARRGTVSSGQQDGISEAALIAAGFSEAEAAYYQRRNDEAAMAQLYLRDQAEREGWIGTPRYFEELGEIRSGLESIRDEMEDEEYARYLYALGRPNQVTIRRVLGGSAAETAGLQPGDVLVGYQGNRVFAASDVRRATQEGAPGDTITLEVMRDGQRIQTYVPRGPLGISMSSDSVLPDDS